VLNTKWKILKKTFKNHEEMEMNKVLVTVCCNSFGVLIDFEDLEENDNKKVSN